MKKRFLYTLVLSIPFLTLISCNESKKDDDTNIKDDDKNDDTNNDDENNNNDDTNNNDKEEDDNKDDDSSNDDKPIEDIDEGNIDNSGTFKIVNSSDEEIEGVDGVYTITTADTYTLSGTLEEGYVYVNAEDQEVELDLDGVTIVSSTQSPIYAPEVDELTVKAKKGTENLIKDTRETKTVDDDNQGEGAISAKADLKLSGSGTLVVSANYNNGVHSTKDLTIKNQTLQVSAPNNAIKGKNSVSFEEGGTFNIISTNGDGIKTENTDTSKKGKQRGTVSISGGEIQITSKYDGIDASYNVEILDGEDDDGNAITPSLSIYSGTYSTPTSSSGDSWDWDNRGNSSSSSSSSSSDSYKGIKADNEVNISSGEIFIKSEDDGIHANYGTSFDSGSTGTGEVNISGGNLTIYSGDDGIHADNEVNIDGGDINVKEAYEAIEGNFITLNDGSVYVYAVDDGLNASNKISQTPYIYINGGYLDVTVASGDTDGIDSNGYYTQSGGVVVTRAPELSGNVNSAAIDTDSGASITGGTIIIVGSYEEFTSVGSEVYYHSWGTSSSVGGGTNTGGPGGGPGGGKHGNGSSSSSSSDSISLSSGTVGVVLNSSTVEFNITQSTSLLAVYSSDVTSGRSYNILNNSSVKTSWTAK